MLCICSDWWCIRHIERHSSSFIFTDSMMMTCRVVSCWDNEHAYRLIWNVNTISLNVLLSKVCTVTFFFSCDQMLFCNVFLALSLLPVCMTDLNSSKFRATRTGSIVRMHYIRMQRTRVLLFSQSPHALPCKQGMPIWIVSTAKIIADYIIQLLSTWIIASKWGTEKLYWMHSSAPIACTTNIFYIKRSLAALP